jgi:hypothetical protein
MAFEELVERVEEAKEAKLEANGLDWTMRDQQSRT